MDRTDAIDRLRALEPELRRRGVRSLYMFGSTAREAARADSDLDLFFDDDPRHPLSYFRVISLGHFLNDALGVRVDLIPRDSLHRFIRDEVVESAVRVY